MRLSLSCFAKSLRIALSPTGGHWGLKMLPNGWVKKKVGDLFEVQLGKMLNQLAKEQNPQYEYLGNSDIQWGKINTENLNTMFFSVREIQKFHLACGDILMCEGGEVGRCAIWKNQKQDILYQKAIHRLRSKGNIIPEYFYGYMISIAGTKLLDDFTTKTSIAHLTQEKLLELPVIVPPLPEQKKIAQILSTWDKAITTTEQLIANSQQQKKALMQQLLTGKKRLLDDNGVRFSGEWEKVKLKDVCQIKTGKKDVNEGNPDGKYAFFTCANGVFGFQCRTFCLNFSQPAIKQDFIVEMLYDTMVINKDFSVES